VHNVLVTGEWMHVAGTYDGTNMKLYLNGALINSATVSGGMSTPAGNFTLSSSSTSLDGKLDEVRVWSRALTENEIRERMHQPLDETENGIKHYWQFNASSGTSLRDAIGGADGTLNNMSDANWLPATYPLGIGTVSTQTETLGTVNFSGTDLRFQYYSHNSASVTVTRLDMAPNVLPDGVLQTFDNQYWVFHRYGTGSFDGRLQLVLSEGITLADESSPQELKLFWREENSDGPWQEIAAAYYASQETNRVQFIGVSVPGQFIVARRGYSEDSFKGHALSFDGVDDYVNVGNSDWTSLGISFTIEAWINPTNLSTRQAIFSTRYTNQMNSFQLEIGPGNGGVNRVVVSGVGTWIAQTQNNAIAPGEWVHIAYVRSGEINSQQKIYVNGVLQTLSQTATYSIISNTTDRMIGCGTNGTQLYQGSMDELRIWSEARTADQIREFMFRPLGDPPSTLRAYWQFNEGNGFTTKDNYASNHGTLINTTDPWVSSGFTFGPGTAFSADEASDDWVEFPGTGVSMYFDVSSGARWAAYRINDPEVDHVPDESLTLDSQYWIISRFGSGNFELSLTLAPAEDIIPHEAQPETIHLNHRPINSSDEWVWIDSAVFVHTTYNYAMFMNVTSTGQFILSKDEVTPMVPPENVQITLLEDGRLKLTWDAAPGAETYEIYRSSDPNTPWEDWQLLSSFVDDLYYYIYPPHGDMMFYRVVSSTSVFGK